jgi:alpha-ribazole phosphatase
MLIYLLRHGLTEYNAQKRYQGQRDIPLSPEGLAQLRRADIDPKVVYISTLQRTRQTAEVLFPDAELVPVDGLKEMCFGSFEGRNYIEMEHDPDYQAWVAANCESSCPDGERKDDFSDRVCRTFAALVDKALADGEEMLVLLAHGGDPAVLHKDLQRSSFGVHSVYKQHGGLLSCPAQSAAKSRKRAKKNFSPQREKLTSQKKETTNPRQNRTRTVFSVSGASRCTAWHCLLFGICNFFLIF